MLYNMILQPRHISLHYLYVHSLTLGLSENGSAGNISGFTPANDANNTGNAQRKGIQGLVQKGMLYNMILQGLVCYII